jgi:hypothetical protein
MIKTFVATGFSCLAIGSIAGYLVSELTKQPSVSQASTMQNAIKPIETAKPLDRNELEGRFIACIGRNVRLTAFTDKELNNDLFDCERSKAR